MNQQQFRTTALECTAEGTGLKLILQLNICPRFCCCQTRKNVKLALRLPYLSNVSQRGNNQLYIIL